MKSLLTVAVEVRRRTEVPHIAVDTEDIVGHIAFVAVAADVINLSSKTFFNRADSYLLLVGTSLSSQHLLMTTFSQLKVVR